jgi:hypothetical protein
MAIGSYPTGEQDLLNPEIPGGCHCFSNEHIYYCFLKAGGGIL